MTWNSNSIEAPVLRMQNDFLETPALHLTLPQAVRRFGVDKTTYEAVLDALVDAKVLTKGPGGVYTRFFPRGFNRGRIRERRNARARRLANQDSFAGGNRPLESDGPAGPRSRTMSRVPAKTTPLTDAEIFAEARLALDRHPTMPGTVRVHIDDGVATLTGSVRRSSERAEADKAVRRVHGVRRLVNKITVAQTPSTEGFQPPDNLS